MRSKRHLKTVIIYDSEGNPEQTSWANARDMVRHNGYSLQPPLKPEEEAKKGRGRNRKREDGALEVLDATKGKPNAPDLTRPLEKLTRTDLIALAKQEFNFELDPNRNTEYMVWSIQKLREGMTHEEVYALMIKEFGAAWGMPDFVQGGAGSSPNDRVSFVSDVRPG